MQRANHNRKSLGSSIQGDVVVADLFSEFDAMNCSNVPPSVVSVGKGLLSMMRLLLCVTSTSLFLTSSSLN